MHLDIARFSGPQVEKFSAAFGEKIIVAMHQPCAGSSEDQLSCAVILRKDASALQSLRGKCDFVAVQGSSPELCAWAANSKGVDLLLQPFSSEKCFLDIETANVLRDNNVFVCILFSDFLECDGFRLGQLLKNAAMCVKLCEKAGTKILLASGAKNESQLRPAKDLSSFGVMLGMKKENALKVVRENPELFLARLVK